MARSPATPTKLAAATGGYIVFWALLVAVAAPRAPVPRAVATVAAHPRGAAGAWAAVAHRVYDEVERRMHKHAAAQRHGVARTVLEEASRAAMDPMLVLAVIQIESRFDPRAVSPVGAAGLMQLLRPTMREELARWKLGAADPFDPVANVRAGVRYLDRMLDAFDDLDLALMAYNAGPGRIQRYLRSGGIPERFFAYPRNVTRAHARLAARFTAPSGAPPRPAVAHAPAPGGDEVRAAAERAAGAAARRPPSASAAAPMAIAVPAGPRRRDVTGS